MEVLVKHIWVNSSLSQVHILLGNSIVNGEQVAIKVEPVKAPLPLLEYESRVYKCLAGGGYSFPFHPNQNSGNPSHSLVWTRI